MQRVEVTRRIAGTPQAVWDAYTDHASWSEWAGFSRSRIEREGDPPPGGVGCVRVFGSGPFDSYEEILSFEPPKRMTYRITRGGLPIRDHFGEVELSPEGDGTRVTWRCRFDSRIPGLGGVFRALIRRVFANALDGLAARHFPER